MRGLLIKGLDVTEIEASELDEYYNAIGCELIDIVTRKINGKYFDVIVDDEGLLKENPIPTMFDVDLKPMLVGNLIIAGVANSEGELTDLSDDDIELIEKKLRIAIINDSKYACLIDCGF